MVIISLLLLPCPPITHVSAFSDCIPLPLYWLQTVALGDLSSVASGSTKDVSNVPATLEILSPLSTVEASGSIGGDHEYGNIGSILEMPELTHDR